MIYHWFTIDLPLIYLFFRCWFSTCSTTSPSGDWLIVMVIESFRWRHAVRHHEDDREGRDEKYDRGDFIMMGYLSASHGDMVWKWYGNAMDMVWKWYDISWDQQSKNKQPFNSSQHLDFCSSKIGSVPGGFINIGIASISQSVWIPRTLTHKPCSDHGCKYDWGYFRLFHERIIVMSQVCNVCWLWRQVFNPPKVLLTESCMNGGNGWNSPGLQAMDSFRS